MAAAVAKPDGPSSPRAWGCFFFSVFCEQAFRVFPTCVGVFLQTSQRIRIVSSLPHVRGGVSHRVSRHSRTLPSSPRAWGCFPCRPLLIKSGLVFPTCVGVFPTSGVKHQPGGCLPHVRGGVSF